MYKQRRQKQEPVPKSDPKVGRPCGAFLEGRKEGLCVKGNDTSLTCGRMAYTSGNGGPLSCLTIPGNRDVKPANELNQLGIKSGDECDVYTLIDAAGSGQLYSLFKGKWVSVGGSSGGAYKCQLDPGPY